MKKVLIALLLALFATEQGYAQSAAQVVATCGTVPLTLPLGSVRTIFQDVNGQLCTNATSGGDGTGTVGAAVPATGTYDALNVAGTLRGWSGVATGALYAGSVAVVDASGNQITSFGASNTFGAAFPATGGAIGFSDGTNMVAGRVTSSAITDATTPPTSSVQQNQNFNMIWNGAAWDRAQGLTAGTLNVPSTQYLSVQSGTQYPAGATPLTATATGTTAATTATLAGAAAKTTYLCGLSIRANATAAATGNATVTGTITATLNFTQWTAPAATGLGVTEPSIGPLCIPASTTNTAIAVVSAAPGAGGVVSVTAWGFQL